MKRTAYLAEARARGVVNARAAANTVRRWGGSMERAALRRLRLGRGAERAVHLRLLVRNGSTYVLPDQLTAASA